MSDVESYIAKFDAEKRQRLTEIRAIVFDAFPDATEKIYYGIPTLKLGEKFLLCYAAYKNHLSLITDYELTDFLKEKFPQYRYTRATVIFPDEKPFPADFVKEICQILQ